VGRRMDSNSLYTRIYRLGNMLGDVKRLIELLKTFLLASLFRDLLASAHLPVNAVPGQPLRTCPSGLPDLLEADFFQSKTAEVSIQHLQNRIRSCAGWSV